MTIFLAHILPGAGHLYIGKKQIGVSLFLASVGLSGAILGMQTLEQHHLWWIFLRASTLTYLYAILDAGCLAIEIPDGRVQNRGTRPRTAALFNLLTYGVGYWMLDRRALAAGSWAFGIGVHLWLGSLHPAFLVMAEVALAVSAWHAYREAKAVKVAPSLELGDRPTVVPDTSPRWLMPGLSTFAGLSLLFLVVLSSAYRIVMGSMEIDQTRALAVEPYYRNSTYGVSLEMNAPGWSFKEAAPNEFVTAYHVAEDAWVRLSVWPRVPGFLKSERIAREVVDKSILFGYDLQVVGGEPVRVGDLNGYQITARGHQIDQPREVFILAVEKGFREYVLWFEWAPSHEQFANAELVYLLDNFQVEEQTAAGTWQVGSTPDAPLAR